MMILVSIINWFYLVALKLYKLNDKLNDKLNNKLIIEYVKNCYLFLRFTN